MIIELGPPVSKSSTRISKFYNSTDSEHKLHKTRIENWHSIGFELEFPWMETYSQVITTAPCSTNSMMGSLKVLAVLYTHFQSLATILETFISLKLYKCSQNLHPASYYQIPIKTNHSLFNRLQTLQTY